MKDRKKRILWQRIMLPPGEVVNLETWAEDLATDQTKAIVKTEEMEIIRLVIPAGKDIPNHKVSGPITVHCIKGRIEFTAMGATQKLAQGELLHLMPGEPHSVKSDRKCSRLINDYI